jgi:hypothetical protein
MGQRRLHLFSNRSKTMEGFKGFFESKAVWGGIVALAGAGTGALHYSVSPADAANAVELFTAIATAAGSLIAIYGRVVATKKIGS